MTTRATDTTKAKLERLSGFLKFSGLLERYILRKSDGIICRNHKFKEKLIHQYNILESRISIITSGIDTELFMPFDPTQKKEIRQNLGLQGKKVIGFVASSISYAKGADTLIEAFNKVRSQYPEAKLLLIGRDDIGLKSDRDIIHSGLVKKQDLPAYYNAMDILVFPSRSEGAPKVVMEAAACGILVVASNVGGIPELIEEGKTGFTVAIADTGQITHHCLALIKDRDLREEMGKRARIFAVENFEISKLAERTAEAIKRTAGTQ